MKTYYLPPNLKGLFLIIEVSCGGNWRASVDGREDFHASFLLSVKFAKNGKWL